MVKCQDSDVSADEYYVMIDCTNEAEFEIFSSATNASYFLCQKHKYYMLEKHGDWFKSAGPING